MRAASDSPTRREFLGLAAGLIAAGGLPFRPATSGPIGISVEHPTPRPGIDASRVLTAADLTDTPDVVPVFDLIRQIPQVADGIRCQCECAGIPGYYSLLSCYEGDGMARHCHVCQGVARMASRLHRQGKTLDQIRAAVDAATWG